MQPQTLVDVVDILLAQKGLQLAQRALLGVRLIGRRKYVGKVEVLYEGRALKITRDAPLSPIYVDGAAVVAIDEHRTAKGQQNEFADIDPTETIEDED